MRKDIQRTRLPHAFMEVELQIRQHKLQALRQVRCELRVQRRDINHQSLKRLALLLNDARLDPHLLAVQRHRLPALAVLLSGWVFLVVICNYYNCKRTASLI